MAVLPTRKLDKRITRVWRVSAALNIFVWMSCALLALGLAVAGLDDEGVGSQSAKAVAMAAAVGVAVLTALLVVVFVGFVPAIRWLQWSFEVHDEEIDICKGIFWRKHLVIPLVRVQNVDTRQGPILRANGLASFTVATAAGEHAIPGLEVNEADALRDQVALLARLAQEDV
ncbi:MAG: PH domain-containing protein [Propionibacteriaceae bacterium]|nr:PH domain-containing protein [Propionibacteriaceae bacterium]